MDLEANSEGLAKLCLPPNTTPTKYNCRVLDDKVCLQDKGYFFFFFAYKMKVFLVLFCFIFLRAREGERERIGEGQRDIENLM